MFRLSFIFALILCCSAAPLNDFKPTVQQTPWKNTRVASFDDSQLVDNSGGGYSYFKKQQIDVGPQVAMSNPLSNSDMSEYMRSSALSGKPRTSVAFQQPENQQINRAIPQTHQSDFSSVFNQQHRSGFGQIPHQDVQTWSHQQALLIPQTNVNLQQRSWSNPSMNKNAFVPTGSTVNHIFNPPVSTGRRVAAAGW